MPLGRGTMQQCMHNKQTSEVRQIYKTIIIALATSSALVHCFTVSRSVTGVAQRLRLVARA